MNPPHQRRDLNLTAALAARFLARAGPGHCLELRAFGAWFMYSQFGPDLYRFARDEPPDPAMGGGARRWRPKTVSGYFDDPWRIVQAVGVAARVSAYVTPNPVPITGKPSLWTMNVLHHGKTNE